MLLGLLLLVYLYLFLFLLLSFFMLASVNTVHGYTSPEIYVHNTEHFLQEPKALYNEVKIIPITKIDRQATDADIKEGIKNDLNK